MQAIPTGFKVILAAARKSTSMSDKFRYAPDCKRSFLGNGLLRFDGIHLAKGWSAAPLLILPRCLRM
jgi:hypothetical protein